MRKRSVLFFILFVSLIQTTQAIASQTDKQKMIERLNQLDLLDKLDQLDFQEAIDSANRCTRQRNFSCTTQNINKAQEFVHSPDQEETLSYAKQLYTDELEEVEYERELEREARRQERLAEQRERELEEQMEEDRRREARDFARRQREAEQAASRAAFDQQIVNKLNNWSAEMIRSNQQFNEDLNRNVQEARKIKELQNQQRRQAEQQRLDELQALKIRNEQKRLALVQAQKESKAKREAERRRAAEARERSKQEKKEKRFVAEPSKAKSSKPSSQLVVESMAFCWESSKQADKWRCRGPSNYKDASGDSTTLYEKGLIKQADMVGCSLATLNDKTPWSYGDKKGYALYCKKPLRSYDADVVSDFNMSTYIRSKRKVYKCGYPLWGTCSIHSTGQGNVANSRILD